MATKQTDPNWRNRPRKKAADLKSAQLAVHLTQGDHRAIKRLAKQAGGTLTDYVVGACLGR